VRKLARKEGAKSRKGRRNAPEQDYHELEARRGGYPPVACRLRAGATVTLNTWRAARALRACGMPSQVTGCRDCRLRRPTSLSAGCQPG